MEKDFQKAIFDRSLMTCVFVGIFGTLLCMVYAVFSGHTLNILYQPL